MKCPTCQTRNPDDATFCSECNNELGPNKFVSLNQNVLTQSYTPRFLSENILTTQSAVEGERKQVTVLFADVTGYTAMSEKLDPEDVHKIMDGCFKIIMDEVHSHHGTINQFTGDGVMALFGAPMAVENHAKNACLAALAIQKTVKSYSLELETKFSIPFKMRIGLNSGPVVVGAIGDDLRMDYTAIGDTTNLAARMEQMANPETIQVSQNTHKRVNKDFRFEHLGKVKVKGKEKPLDVYRLIGKRVKSESGFNRQIFSYMVGREKELNTLEIQVLKAVNGEGSVVNVIGEAGIGKSRLIAELKSKEIINQVTLFEGRAISMGRNLSFHPIIDLLKHWAQIREDDKDVAAFSKLEASVKRICAEDADEIIPFVATLMGMKLIGRFAERIQGIEGEALEKLILKNVRDLLKKATEITPLVIVLEDMHWADTSSLELSESLFRLAETCSILFINVFRPDYSQTDSRIIDTINQRLSVYYVEIKLDSLNEQMSETLINNMLNIRGLFHDIRNTIIQRSGGNPFFIEEVVRSFIDQGAIIVNNNEFQVTDKVHEMVIPHTINDVLLARIDRLEENTRNLIKVASVIGRNFFYRILSEVATNVKDIDNKLSYLKEIQLIRDRRRMEELEYLFKHALAQEAAYESILLQKRKEIHLHVAESIEQIFKQRLHEFYGMLAFHYSKAEKTEKVEEYLIKAGEEALKASASSEALNYYQKAMDIYINKYGDAIDPSKMAALEENVGFAFFQRGHNEEAVIYFDRALKNLGFIDPKNKVFMISLLIFNLFVIILNLYFPIKRRKAKPSELDNKYMKIIMSRVKALTIVDSRRLLTDNIAAVKRSFKLDISESQFFLDALSGSSGIFSFTGFSFRISQKLLDYAKINVFETVNNSILKYVEAVHNLLVGNWCIEFDEKIVDSALEIGDIYIASSYLYISGVIYAGLGDFDRLEKIIIKLKTIYYDFNYENTKVQYLILTAFLFEKKRELDNALKICDEYIAVSKKISEGGRDIIFYGLKSGIVVMKNDLDQAATIINETSILVQNEAFITPYYYGWYLKGLFLYNLAMLKKSITSRDNRNIKKYKKVALKNGKELMKNNKKNAYLRPEAYRFMGKYYALINKQKLALSWYNRSIQESKRIIALPDLSRAYMETGKCLLKSESKLNSLNGIKAQEYLEMARSMFEEMDLKWDLDELERLSDRL